MRFLLTLLTLFLAIASLYASQTLVSYQSLPGWQTGSQQYAIKALQSSCPTMRSAPWRIICQGANQLPTPLPASTARAFFERYFRPYSVSDNGNPNGLFTGYFAPEIKGSLKPTSYYRVPLYGKPYNLVRARISGRLTYRLRENGQLVMPPSRAMISSGPALSDTPVLAWIHSKVDRFFLQIQGSGLIQLTDGDTLLLGYAGQNGHRYYAIGKYLVSSGAVSKQNISLQSIKSWLYSHPSEAARVMNLNPSFVFFRKINASNVIGAQGVPLTPGRSLAVDRRHMQLGTPIWLASFYPKVVNGKITDGRPLRRLMVAQDTGGAIRGFVRGDVYWGSGSRAEWLAGHMQSDGQYWILLPR